MPGEIVELEGDAGALVSAVLRLDGYDFALIGGLAVMVRLREAHRATADLDGVFDNPTDVPTTAALVAAGVARDAAPPQRVIVEGTDVDVIDTFALPDDTDALPNDPRDRLFVCAHRFAYESALPVHLADRIHSASVRVAVAAALVATKAHALRFGSPQRRARKRSSDLHDLYRLAATDTPGIVTALDAAPWDLRRQVATALAEDVADLEQAAATMRSAPAAGAIDTDDFIDIITDLRTALDT